MKKYVYLINNIVVSTFPEVDPARPDTPVTDLYAPDFLAQCIIVDETTETPSGWIYDRETGAFSAPPAPEPAPLPEPVTPEPTTTERIAALEAQNTALSDTIDMVMTEVLPTLMGI